MSDDDEPLLPRPNKTPDRCGNLHIRPEDWIYESAQVPNDPHRKRALCPKCNKFMAYCWGSVDPGGKLSKERSK